ncbi:MAG: hypothetical protein PXX73_01000, partial [Sideroxydans sp.]|nr:hypothetical protein [Sideroxydans sp.]
CAAAKNQSQSGLRNSPVGLKQCSPKAPPEIAFSRRRTWGGKSKAGVVCCAEFLFCWMPACAGIVLFKVCAFELVFLLLLTYLPLGTTE